MRPGRGRDEGDKAARDPGDAGAPCPADLAGPALRAAMRAVCAAALVVAAAAAAVATSSKPRFVDAIIMLAALLSLFAACDASMKAADRLETTYKVQEEDDEEDVIKEAPLTLVKEGTSDESGTWAPGRGADFAVRSSTYLDNGVKKPSCEPLYTVGVAGFAMSAGAVANGTRPTPRSSKLRGEDADRDVLRMRVPRSKVRHDHDELALEAPS